MAELSREQNNYSAIIEEQTNRALWEVNNLVACVPDSLWDKKYCEMPMWKHIYHMLHSLDLWFINPRDENFSEPAIHEKDLNDLNTLTEKELSRHDIENYCKDITIKITGYLKSLKDEALLLKPPHCEYSRFSLILAQYRHLHCHVGIIMGFIIDDTGKWPRVLGLEGKYPTGEFNRYF
jgi:hypothetical protein